MKWDKPIPEDRKVEICSRAYDILVNQVGFPPEDIIFDPNIFAIGTGIEEHNNYGVDSSMPQVVLNARYRTQKSRAGCQMCLSHSVVTT